MGVMFHAGVNEYRQTCVVWCGIVWCGVVLGGECSVLLYCIAKQMAMGRGAVRHAGHGGLCCAVGRKIFYG